MFNLFATIFDTVCFKALWLLLISELQVVFFVLLAASSVARFWNLHFLPVRGR